MWLMYTTAEVLLYKTMKLHANNSFEDKELEASKKHQLHQLSLLVRGITKGKNELENIKK